MPYTVKSLKLEGFRGFRDFISLDFEPGLVILRGPNRSGKSSTVNAIAWAIAGGEVAKKDLGPVTIRERVGWEATNLEAKNCKVTLSLEGGDDGGDLVIERTGGRGGGAVVMRRGDEIHSDPLKALGLSVDSLVSSVFLPQEVVRAPVSVEPKSRERVFAQLAGLGSLSALEEALSSSSAAIKGACREIQQLRDVIDGRIKAQVGLKKADLEKATQQAETAGLTPSDLNRAAAPQLAQRTTAAISAFCTSYSIEVLLVPEVTTWHDLEGFIAEVRSSLRVFEAESPETTRQSEVFQAKSELQNLLDEHGRFKVKREELKAQRVCLSKNHGTQDAVSERLDLESETLDSIENEIEQAGKMKKMISDALAYFESLPSDPPLISCPVCQTEEVDLKHVREHLSQEIEEAGLQPLHTRRDACAKRKRELLDVVHQYTELASSEESLQKSMDELRDTVADTRGESVGTAESVERILKSLIGQKESQLNDLKDLIRKRGMAIEQVRESLEKADAARAVHEASDFIDRLDDLPESADYRELKTVGERADLYGSIVRELLAALGEERTRAFESQFELVRADVNDYYRELVGRRDFPEIWIDPGKWEVVAGKDGRGRPVTTFFNIGDLTAVALCLFLSSAVHAQHDAGFVLLDDPSQNLDDDHEARLAALLADLARNRQVIVTSTRTSFLQSLERSGTVVPQIIELAPWDDSRSVHVGRT
ncbi:MAG: AAA family ATPase [Candidatus Eisenbacteria bacterium]